MPEHQVYMATAVSGLLRSVANTMGTAIAAVVWDLRYSHRLLQYADEHAAQLPTQALAMIQDRLVVEARTAAWQDYFLFNALLATLCLFPALSYWRHEKYGDPATPQAAAAPVHLQA